MNDEKTVKEKKKKLIEKILNHHVQGEVYISTKGQMWKMLVLKYFNKAQKGN